MASGQTSRSTARSYDQWCPVAVGLDILGDRWVLLILRELLIDDRRFTDLRRELPGIAPNLLSDRLRQLVDLGLVTTVELPPPAARTVYRVTEDGRAATPVLRALARFGIRYLDGTPGATFDATRAAHALLLPWRRRTQGRLHLRLVVDGEAVDLQLQNEETRVGPEEPSRPDVTIVTTLPALQAARRDGTPLDAELDGTPAACSRALAAFSLEVVPRS
jgi:DNA-binding HxlR family transcriptional regulator